MKALTLQQPWASLFACGAKKYIVKPYEIDYRGKIAIYSANINPASVFYYGLDIDIQSKMWEALRGIKVSSCVDLPIGCIIAFADIVWCARVLINPIDHVRHFLGQDDGLAVCIDGNELLFDNWIAGNYVMEFENVVMLNEPIIMQGKDGLWDY